MTEDMAQETAVRLLTVGSSREFNQSFEELRGWGYAVTAAQDPVGFADENHQVFDLACVEIGPDSDAPLPLDAIRKKFLGLGVLGLTTLESEALERALVARKTSRSDFAAILEPPLTMARLIFAVEEALVRRGEPEHVVAGHEQQRSIPPRRRSQEAGRLSDFTVRDTERGSFPGSQPVKSFKGEENMTIENDQNMTQDSLPETVRARLRELTAKLENERSSRNEAQLSREEAWNAEKKQLKTDMDHVREELRAERKQWADTSTEWQRRLEQTMAASKQGSEREAKLREKLQAAENALKKAEQEKDRREDEHRKALSNLETHHQKQLVAALAALEDMLNKGEKKRNDLL